MMERKGKEIKEERIKVEEGVWVFKKFGNSCKKKKKKKKKN